MVIHDSDRANGKEAIKKPHRIRPDWYSVLAAFRVSSNRKAIWQLVNTLVPYGCLLFLMIRSIQLDTPTILTLALAVPAAAFLVRLFILFHDCVHNSFFTSKSANKFFGYLLGVLVFTSFEDWRYSHLRHHATNANLDARGFGDIWTLTRKEYEDLPKRDRFLYRIYRNPLVLIGLGALFIFLLSNRIPKQKERQKKRTSVLLTNLLIIAMVLVASWFIGWQSYLLVQLPVLWLAGVSGIWLFYVQHQFKGVYWARKKEWEPLRAAMEGSSYYKLPAILRWFSGNIGYHHIHHLSPRIPNYHLKRCFNTVPALNAKAPLTILKSVACIRQKIWDEEKQEMISFPQAGQLA